METLNQDLKRIVTITIPLGLAPAFSDMLFAQGVCLHSFQPLSKGGRPNEFQLSLPEWVNFPAEKAILHHGEVAAKKETCCLEIRGERPLTLIREFAQKKSLTLEEKDLEVAER